MSYHRISRFLLIVLLLASGCIKVGPDFQKPEASVSPNWLEAGEYKQVSTKAEDYRDWWRAFNDPVLDKLIQTAYQENLPLRIAGVRVLAARAQLGVAVGELYPQSQKGSGSVQKERLSETTPLAVPGTPPSFLVIPDRADRQLGNRFLGQVSPGRRVRRCRPAGRGGRL